MWRNIILFAVLCIAVIAGWYWAVVNFAQPDPEVIAKNQEIAEKKQKELAEKKAKELAEKKKKDEQKPEKPPEPVKPKDVAKDAPKGAPLQNDVLGGEGFHLTVKTISRGAGVRRWTPCFLNCDANWRL